MIASVVSEPQVLVVAVGEKKSRRLIEARFREAEKSGARHVMTSSNSTVLNTITPLTNTIAIFPIISSAIGSNLELSKAQWLP